MSVPDGHSADATALNPQLASAGLQPLSDAILAKFDTYLRLLVKWNARINLTAVRDPQDILSRHFVESIACAQHLPQGIGSLLDFGSGAGFPGIPVALCRPDIAVTLADSQNKKASFLREVVRGLGLSTTVFAHRAEDLKTQFDCVTLRAVDQMSVALVSAAKLVRRPGCLAVMTTNEELGAIQSRLGTEFKFSEPILLPGSHQRVLALAFKGNGGP